ncbi:MAG: copper-containing nitrite reductase [Ignavibacteriaceae bacterium]|nr:copper-containing nitrite reductase [Ignavibacteriaceae bacterium]
MKNRRFGIAGVMTGVITGIAVVIIIISGCGETYSKKVRGEEYAKLTHAPLVPLPITRNYPTKVIVNLETKEIIRRLADNAEYNFWTFGGDVPGKFIRIRVGDMVEFHLSNDPDSKMPHNIDLHAVSGPGGGATSSFTAPGHTSIFSFTAMNPGLFVYHCATSPVALHIANGMYGLILVEPEEGLPPVDREYYIMQSEFYTEGKFGESGLQTFSQDKAVDERPSYVVFNGSVGSLTGDRALPCKAGETIRLFVGNAGPNLTSSFHVIGTVFDKVYGEGGTKVTQTNVQTTLIPAGGSAIVEFKIRVPGTYTIVDHSIFRAFNKGAIATIKAEGKEDLAIYSGKQKDEIYYGSDTKEELWGGVQEPSATTKTNSSSNVSPADFGKTIFMQTCIPCHQPDGKGIAMVFPPLAGSDFLNQNKERAIETVINGRQGATIVNGKNYNGIMPPPNLTEEQIAEVLTFVYSQWGNSGQKVTADEVRKIKSKKTTVSK